MLHYMERAFPKALQVVQPLIQFSWYHNFTALLYAFKGKLLGPKFNVWIIFNSCKTHWLTTLYKLVMILLICGQGCSIYENKVCVYDWDVLFQAVEGCRQLRVMSRTHLQSTTPTTMTNLRPPCSSCQAARAT